MGINRGMTPGGDSEQKAFLRLLRKVSPLLHRVERDKTKGITNVPIANRGIMVLESGGQKYILLTDVVLKELMGIFGDTGKAVISADRYSNELDPDDATGATQDVDNPGVILYKGTWLHIGSEDDIGEIPQMHCLLNGSFENLGDDGSPEFWTAKP